MCYSVFSFQFSVFSNNKLNPNGPIVYCDFINAEAESFCMNTLGRVEYVIILIHSTFPTNKGTRLFLLARNFWLTNLSCYSWSFLLVVFSLSLGFLLTHAFKGELFITRGHEAALLAPSGSKTSDSGAESGGEGG